VTKASDNVFPRFLVSEGGSTATPAADSVTVYAKADGLLYSKDDAGTETLVSSGPGGASDILDIPTAEMDDTLVLAPDGAGGVEFRAEAGGGGGALVLLEQHTAATAATLDFSTFISSTYDTYVIEIVRIVPDTDNVNFVMLMGTGAGPTWDTGANYAVSNYRWISGGSAFGGGINLNSINVTNTSDTVDISGYYGIQGRITLYDPQAAAAYKPVMGQIFYWNNAAKVEGLVLSGVYQSLTAVTGIRFLFSTGNIAVGTIRIYGMTK